MAKPVLRDTKPAERLSRARQRLKLIDACITALHQHGPSRTTIDKVVTIADMSPGIVNFYFETKAALLVAALEHLAVEFEQLVLEPLAELRHTPLAALDRLIDLYLDPNVASARKVSVWYSFWGESNSRREYYTICGKRDLAFAALVQELVERVIREARLAHLDADAVALGLIGCLEMMWQEIAFQEEADVDRQAAKKRCRAYLRSVFPAQFAAPRAALPDAVEPTLAAELAMFRRSWQFGCSARDIPQEGDYVAWKSAVDRVLILRNGGSAISAFVNTCLHRPHMLVAGESGRLPRAFACSADGTIYGLDGVRPTGGVLQPLHVAVQGAMIFVTHEVEKAGEPPSLPAISMAPAGACHSFDVAADWKLVVEQWADAYFDTDARAFGAGERTEISNDEGTLFSLALVVRGEARSFSANTYVQLCASLKDARAVVQRRLIWPNLFVEERPDGVTIRQVLPLAHGKSLVRVRRYGRAAPDRAARVLTYLAARLERAWEADDVRAAETTLPSGGAQEAGPALMAWKAKKNDLF